MDRTHLKNVAARGQRGMTLIEIMVVVAILGMIASVVGVAVMGQFSQARRETATLDIKGFDDGLRLYKIKHGHYPSSSEGLTILYSEGLLGGTPKKDPWGNEYIYVSPGNKHTDSYDIMSYAADGKPGGDADDADITN